MHRELYSTPGVRVALEQAPPSGQALERHVDATFAQLERSGAEVAERIGGLAPLGVWIDSLLRTDACEHLDDPDCPAETKTAIVRGLHLFNQVTGSYRRFCHFLLPLLRQVHARSTRPVRLLELGAGAGGFSIALARFARSIDLPVEVIASDIVPDYVQQGTAQLAGLTLPVEFRRINALDMAGLADRSVDLIFLAQSLHHFSPGQVARMIAESKRVATTAYVGIDGYRSIPMLGFVVGTAALSLSPAAVHDAWISARRFYAEDALALMARLAAPRSDIHIGRIWPLNTTLTVRFDACAATP